MEELKKYQGTLSGRPSIIQGAKHMRGFVVIPSQILDLLHDTQSSLPIPADAVHQGIGIDDAGVDSKFQFYFTSLAAPNCHCVALKPEILFRILKELSSGMIPLDAELDGIELSGKWTAVMLRVASSHWPAALEDRMPLYHLRYDYGRTGAKELILTDPSKLIEGGQRLRIQ